MELIKKIISFIISLFKSKVFDFEHEYKESDIIIVFYKDKTKKSFDGLTFNVYKKGIKENLYDNKLCKVKLV